LTNPLFYLLSLPVATATLTRLADLAVKSNMKKRQNFIFDMELILKARTKAASLGLSLTKVITELLTNWIK